MDIFLEFWQSLSSLGKIELITLVGAMLLYVIQAITHPEFTPHPITFGIWLIADVVNYFTYKSFSIYMIGPTIMMLGASIVVSWGTIKLIKSKIKNEKNEKIKLGFPDLFAIFITLISLFIFFSTGNGKISNLMIQIILFIGFIPIILNLIKSKRTDEPLFSWILFIIGWGFTCVDTMIGYKDIIELIYPLINGFLGCSIVLIISIYNKYKK